MKQSDFGFSILRQIRKRIGIIELVRTRRETANQNLGFASRPFVLCGLPVKGPPKGARLHERRNGQFLLQVIETDTQRGKATVMQHGRFNFMREAGIWYTQNPDQEMLPGGFENEVVLSDEFYREILDHSIPADLEAAKALSCSPAALDLFMWLCYRCFTAQRRERVSTSGGSVTNIWLVIRMIARTSGWGRRRLRASRSIHARSERATGSHGLA